MRPELRRRLIYGFAITGLVIAALAWDFHSHRHWGVLSLFAVAVVIAGREFARLAKPLAPEIQRAPLIAISLVMIPAALFDSGACAECFGGARATWALTVPWTALALALGSIWVVLVQMFSRGPERFFLNVGLTLFGVVYLGITAYLVTSLLVVVGGASYYGGGGGVGGDYANRGNQLLLVFLASVKLGDVAAFFGGRAFGRHKLAPAISPGKTWEGFAFSFVGSIGGAYLFASALTAICDRPPFNSWWQPAVWGLVLGPLGVVGDLAESCMKREVAVKDSGTSMPGFGGILDILDALILAAPVAYVLALLT